MWTPPLKTYCGAMRTRLILTAAVATITMSVTSLPLSGASSSSLSGKSAAQVISVSKTDTVARQYGQVVVSATLGKSKLTEVVTLGPSFGVETIDLPSLKASGSLVNVGGALYAKGNAGFLSVQLNASDAAAKKWAGKWIKVPGSDENYTTLAAGLTMSTGMSSIYPTSKLSLGKQTNWKGVSVVEVDGMNSGTKTKVFVAAASPHVIVAATQEAASTVMETSKYATPFSVAVPTGWTLLSATGI